MRNLEFGPSKFDAVICLYGKLPKKKVLKSFSKSVILAADGAGLKLLKKGVLADYIIGDLDSIKGIKKKIDFKNTKIIKIDDQETNDFEKNLLFAQEKGYENILIIGFHGGELEHSLNNWSVLIRYSRFMNLCIYDKFRYGIPIRESITLQTLPNEIISIIPQTYAKIRTKNLKWVLNNEALELGMREGARNVATSERIELELIEGEYILFLNSRLPYSPIYKKL
jgi:thiamine pyrophosphokinase